VRIPSLLVGARRVLLAATLIALSAVTARVIYAVTVGAQEMEWFEAWHTAQRKAFAHFSTDDDLSRSIPFVLRHHEACFPTERAWIWARLRHSAQAVSAEAGQNYMACLRELAEFEERQRGWKPPGGGQARGPQNNEMQLTRSASDNEWRGPRS
jgi:hypothetical protein